VVLQRQTDFEEFDFRVVHQEAGKKATSTLRRVTAGSNRSPARAGLCRFMAATGTAFPRPSAEIHPGLLPPASRSSDRSGRNGEAAKPVRPRGAANGGDDAGGARLRRALPRTGAGAGGWPSGEGGQRPPEEERAPEPPRPKQGEHGRSPTTANMPSATRAKPRRPSEPGQDSMRPVTRRGAGDRLEAGAAAPTSRGPAPRALGGDRNTTRSRNRRLGRLAGKGLAARRPTGASPARKPPLTTATKPTGFVG